MKMPISCEACEGTSFRKVQTVKDWHLKISDDFYDYYQCIMCGLVFQYPQLSNEELVRFYPSGYECYVITGDQNSKSFIKNKLIHFGFNKRWSFVERYKSSGKILDIGCATGNFLFHKINDRNWDLHGLEINEKAAKIANLRGLNVIGGVLEDVNHITGSFDVVTMWDVLEHINNPKLTLLEIARILKPKGIVVVRVPNFGGWDYKIFKRYWHGFDAPRHLFVFNFDSLKSLLEELGFTVCETSYEYGGYMAFVFDLRIWFSAKGFSEKFIHLASSVLYHPVIRAMLSPFAALITLLFPGPSLTVVAVKK